MIHHFPMHFFPAHVFRKNEARFTRDTAHILAHYHAYERASRLSEGRLVLDVARVAVACGLRPAAEMTLLGKTLLNLEAESNPLDPNLDVKRIVREHLQEVMRKHLMRSLSPAHLASELLDMHELVSDSPRRLTSVMLILSENRFRVNLNGLEDSHLI